MAIRKQDQSRSGMTLRIPLDLKERLERMADTNKRSLTREIEVALQKYADEHDQIDKPDTNVAS